MVEPEVEGSDVYLAVRLDSPWGLTTLAMAESIMLKVNGVPVSGDPIETAVGETVRVTGRGRGLLAVKKPSMSRLNCNSNLVSRPYAVHNLHH